MHLLYTAAGIDFDQKMPWLRQWYCRYQLPDGGLNCDESAYLTSEKSSMVSTLPPLETVLLTTKREYTGEEIRFLDRGAQYLLWRHLGRNSQTRNVIDPEWYKICFPRFYEYDILRGLSFVVNWAHKLGRTLPLRAISEVVQTIDAAFPDGRVKVQREIWSHATSKQFDTDAGVYRKGPANAFPLLRNVGTLMQESPQLTQLWNECRLKLAELIERKAIIEG